MFDYPTPNLQHDMVRDGKDFGTIDVHGPSWGGGGGPGAMSSWFC